MSRQQVLALGVCNVVANAGLGGLVGLLPVHLARLGADATVTGLVLACAYVSLALSNLVGGWLSDRVQRRTVFVILGGGAAVPLAWLMSRATTVGPLWLLLACLWFAIGVPMTMVTILTGLFAEAAQRGRRFGLLGLSAGCGLCFGGVV